MILAALKKLAEAEGLMTDPDYEDKNVTRVIKLSESGKLLGLIDIREPDSKGRPRAVKRKVPKTSGRTSGVAAQFLYDKSDYIFGVSKNPETGNWDLTDSQIDATTTLVEEALSKTNDSGLLAISKFLETQKALKEGRSEILPKELSNNEWFVFQLQGDEGLVSDRPLVKDWWKKQRAQSTIGDNVCLVTGVPCVPVDKHDGIKKVPGGSTSGVAIVSFNSPSFESYGFERNENAPVSRQAAEAYVRALNRLLDPTYPNPRHSGKILPRRNFRLNENTAVVFWTADVRNDFADVFEEIFSKPDPTVVARLLEAPKTGGLPRIKDATRFYALTLSGGQGRAIIRDWFTSSVGEMAERIRQYFDDLELAFPFDNVPRPSLQNLLRSVVLGGEDKNIPPNLAADCMQSILRDQPLPHPLLSAAIHRCKAEGPLSIHHKTGKPDWNRSHLLMQVIKAVLRRLKGRPELSEVKSMLDESNRQPPYLLGRLFSVLENLQSAAQGQTNATIGDRFYGAASTAPVTAFPRLMALSKHHLAKLRKDKPGQAINLDKNITTILENFPSNGFPPVLSMEEQGLFAIGYYHQRQKLFSKKEEQSELMEADHGAN